MKKADVIAKKRSGIKWYDYVEQHCGVQAIIDETIAIYLKHPTTWGIGWSTVHWAFGNAFRNLYQTNNLKCRNNGQSAFNLDEVLDQAQIDYIAQQCGITDPFVESWKRD